MWIPAERLSVPPVSRSQAKTITANRETGSIIQTVVEHLHIGRSATEMCIMRYNFGDVEVVSISNIATATLSAATLPKSR